MPDRDWADSDYSRVYHSVIDDPKFATVYADDRAFATWVRLLIGADIAYPTRPPVPASASRVALRVLCSAGVIVVANGHYSIPALAKERQARYGAGKGRPRYPSDDKGKPELPRTPVGAQPESSRSKSESPVRAPDSDSDSISDSLSEGGAGGTPDLLDAYYRLTARFPSGNTADWLGRLENEYGTDAASRQLAAAFTDDPSPRTLLSRTENELRSEKHAAEKAERDAETTRLEEWNRTRKLTPEQVAERQARVQAELRKMTEKVSA